MADLAQRLDDLRDKLENLSSSATASEISELEAEARDLLAQTKNTEYEDEARQLFTLLAKRSAPTATKSEASSEVRALLRRARIRIDVANDDRDLDEAIDILAQALELDPENGETQALLIQAAERSAQHALKVQGLLDRFGIEMGEAPPAASHAASTPLHDDDMPIMTPAQQSLPPLPPEGDPLAEVSKAYYAGDYQKAVEAANRILSADPNNGQAQEYRQKAEDNLMRGVVPDHRIPFDARVAYNRANSLVRAGNYDEAQALYRQARDLAARAGISQWNDVEQALIDIQDLALARELLNEGDRLLAGDDWDGALRKYEGALRVVPNDPLAEERVALINRVKEQFDRTSVQLNMMSGSLLERADALSRLMGSLATTRQMLPGSDRISQLVAETQNRMDGIKAQILSQASNLITRAETASSLEEKSKFSQEARSLLTVAVGLDPTDPAATNALQRAEGMFGKLSDTRQNIDRATALIAQNTESELAQARNMLADMRESASDPRYRATVADLLAAHMGHIEAALDRGDVSTAERWLKICKEEPFRILGRRTEILHFEDEIRKMRRGRFLMRLGFAAGGIALLALLAFISRGAWEPTLFPTATPTATITQTPSATASPTTTDTPTPTASPTSTATPTLTPSPTVTPSFTVTASLTPTHTLTPTETFTPSLTPTITETPAFLCRVFVTENVNLRSRPSTSAEVVRRLTRNQPLDVLEQHLSIEDGQVWYRIVTQIEDAQLEGWIRADLTVPVTDCPAF